MRIDRLSIKGLLRFDAPIALDFTALPPGIIAVVGPNGAGKSTLMEAMLAGFYRRMVRGEILDCITARDAHIDVQAAFDGRGSYRARVNLDQVARKTDAVLERVTDVGRTLLSDGKASTFDQAIAREFPSFEQILCSAYAAQNQRGSFKSLGIKGRRDVFGEMLGLAQYAKHCETCREAARAVERRLGELRAIIERLAAETTDHQRAALEAEGREHQQRIDDARQHHDSSKALVAEFERRRQGQLVLAAAYTKAQWNLADARERQDALKEELRAIETEAVGAVRAFERRRLEIESAATRIVDQQQAILAAEKTPEAIEAERLTAIQRIDARLNADLDDRDERIQNNLSIVERAGEIRAAAARVADTRANIERIGHEVETYQQDHDARLKDVQALKVEQAGLAGAATERTRVIEAASLLTRVPCGGMDPYAGCELLQSARAAQDRRLELEAKVQRHDALTAQIADMSKECDRRWASVLAARDARQDATNSLTPQLLATADRKPRLDEAETRIAELKADCETLRTRATQDRGVVNELAATYQRNRERQIQASEEAVTKARADETAAIYAVAVEEANAESGFAERRLPVETKLPTVAVLIIEAEEELKRCAPAHDALVTIDAELTRHRERVNIESSVLARAEAEHQAFERRVDDFARRLSERLRLEDAKASLDQHVVEWQALARVFGPDGLQVLEIDQAGPGVSALANDLLQSCFGGRFTVELVTQEPKADGKGMKEVFELRVFDGERGGEPRDLALVSGGEAVLIEEALRSAIAMYVNQRNVLPIRTCWRDETTGALHPDNAPRYVAMLRRIRERGGIHHLFFVTHNPDAAALADAQIVVADGKAEIVLPPFARVA